MSRKRQMMLAVALVAGALLVVVAATWADDGESTAEATTQGHDHAAMLAGGTEAQPVRLDAEAARRIGVTFATATVKPLSRTVSTVGNVTWDETRVTSVNPKIEGWVEALHVDFTGAQVRRGQPLMEVYSPMLVAAQEELILARRLADRATAGGGERAASSAAELLEAARRRLRYLDIPEDVIRRVEESGTPLRTVPILAAASGVVVDKQVTLGARVMPGMDLYRIADLSGVWVEGEVFEKDLSLVRPGQTAQVTFEAYPGEVHTGRVAYVYPTVSEQSRTGRVRVELSNPGQRLKPGMYARVELVAAAGAPSLVVPRSAVHQTGTRALVFVQGPDGMLMPREITVGLVAGEDIEVLNGLSEGDVVVRSANFLVDAEANMGAAMGGMGAAEQPADGASGGHEGHDMAPAIDHSGHDMAPATDHSGHDMDPAPGAAGHRQAPAMDHSGH